VPRLVERDDGDRNGHSGILTRAQQNAKRKMQTSLVSACCIVNCASIRHRSGTSCTVSRSTRDWL
jgi:hypothetical protein